MKIIDSIEAARLFISDRNRANAGELSQDSIASTYNESVDKILNNVRLNGDQSLIQYTKEFDGVDLNKIQLNHEEINNGAKNVSKDLFDALKISSQRIYQFAKETMPSSWFDQDSGLGESVVPMQKVGLYVPGGTAIYPSTVLMSAMIAKAVGVPEIILCTPPKNNGIPDDSILAAAHIAGIDKVYCIGGAQAIAAMAYGTETIPKVDKICGPGNIYVTLAKKKVFGEVGIDGLFGPTETVVIADDNARPEFCAADMLAQAEHDELAFPVLITTSKNVLANVEKELNKQLKKLDRNKIAKQSIDNNCALILVDSIEMCIELSNLIAPEHVCLNIQNANDWIAHIINAGAIFVGDYSAEVMGDYIAGPSHTLPTFGTSRYSSYLGAQQFVKYMPIIGLDNKTVKELIPTAIIISEHEGLTGHRESARIRL
ncbi:MAG: histidinol dehydrogenase [Dehalococcoidia bacterium]|tara:strand:- start:1966 stop:3252 length:1287 start_codon:yes stop_codon:yes gene_type:complete